MFKKSRITILFLIIFMMVTFMVKAETPRKSHLEASPGSETGLGDSSDNVEQTTDLFRVQSLESNGRAIFGYGAGASYTTANYLAFFGTYAGHETTTGYYNTFIGDKAGYSNTTGHNNTFIGANAGFDNVTTYYNTFVGSSAGRNNIANFNCFFGERTGGFNTTGSCNTFVGTESGFYNDTGYNNTFLGFNTAIYNTTGYSNTFIGMYAGTANVSGHGNVYLGYMAGYNETGSDKLYIANSSTTNPLIYGDFYSDYIKIGGTLGIGITPSYPLHLSNGAYCSSGGTWTNASSKEFKENIETLNVDEAMDALNKLIPVKYNYKVDKVDKHVGFIAEEAPELVVTADRKGMSPMDVVAVLTKVVQELKKDIQEQKKINAELQERLAKIEKHN
ncbi:MAG: tail fiber domain-containing protein [Acidobacteria bacterium]|jgi:hypothetical protein|nr:tail fiber domain-containing protein [Acidobacteriota bacterium]